LVLTEEFESEKYPKLHEERVEGEQGINPFKPNLKGQSQKVLHIAI
jgi:hypothetical protein